MVTKVWIWPVDVLKFCSAEHRGMRLLDIERRLVIAIAIGTADTSKPSRRL